MRRAWLAAALLFAAGCRTAPPAASPSSPAPTPPPAAPAFSFALIGDLPYSSQTEAQLPELVASINADPEVAFTIHVGDIKGGGQPCNDAVYDRELARFGTFDRALVYTPGDNEWTDCHRRAAGGFDPQERLAHLRTVFFADPARSMGRQPIAVTSQPGYPENARWERDGVTFATVHAVGSNNNRPTGDQGAGDEKEFRERTDADITWIEGAFANAAGGVVLAMQANPFDTGRNPSGYDRLIDTIESEAASFGKPVLLVNGDTHLFKVDEPIDGVTRVVTFGEPLVGWVKVTVDRSAPELFRIEPQSP